MRTVAVVLAGGTGQRFGGSMPKQLQPLAGKTVLEHSVAAFEQAPGVDEILVVMAPRFTGQARKLLGTGGYRKITNVIEGGGARPDSTRAAIAAIGADAAECDVLFHDAARPLLSQRIIADCVRALRADQAIGVAIPSSDTIVEVSDGVVSGMPRRNKLHRCQTPQGFRLSVIRRAYQLADADPQFATFAATDDCGIVLRYLPDVPIAVVPGSERNIKITYPSDLDVAAALLTRLSWPAARRPRPIGAATGIRDRDQSVASSSISVTRAAIGDRSDRTRVTWANSGCPLSFSITATTPSCRPTRRLSRWAMSWVSTTREPAPILDSTVSSTPRSSDWASSTITNESCSDRPRMWVSGRISSMSRARTSSITSFDVTADSVSKTAWAHGFILSVSEPGR
jgi:2-C-methyl-D-erythritol 4-phosphate cytidylyltransferase